MSLSAGRGSTRISPMSLRMARFNGCKRCHVSPPVMSPVSQPRTEHVTQHAETPGTYVHSAQWGRPPSPARETVCKDLPSKALRQIRPFEGPKRCHTPRDTFHTRATQACGSRPDRSDDIAFA